MRKLNKNLFFLLFALALIGCEKEEGGTAFNPELTTLKEVRFMEAPEVFPASVVLTQDSQDLPAINIAWNKVDFPIKEAPVEYSIQFDLPGNTLGETAWGNASSVVVGNDVLSKSFLVKDLNERAKDLGLLPDEAAPLAFRVRAYVDRAVFSEGVSFLVTPYEETVSADFLYVPGTYQGWDPATAATLGGTAVQGVFEGILGLYDPLAPDFKFTTGPNWDENYGSDGNGNLVFDGNNAEVPAPGSYKIIVNLNDLTWTAEPHTFGIIGTATPGGWDSDTDMQYNNMEGQWEYKGELAAGALKFRLNDQWTVNYGSRNNTDLMAFLDDPGAHTIDIPGNYLITFKIDGADPSVAYYTVEPQ